MADHQPTRTCLTCSKSLYKYPSRAVYCSEKCKVCTHPGCDGKAYVKKLCRTHYNRHRRGYRMDDICENCGKELPRLSGSARYCSPECKPRCKVEMCDKPSRYSNGYCSRHGATYSRKGTPVGKWEWAEESDEYTCRTCRKTFPSGTGSRRYCSLNCHAIYLRHKGDVPSLDFNCAKCGIFVKRNRFEKMKQNPARRYCDDCRKRDASEYAWYRAEIVARGKVNCGICDCPIDLTLQYPEGGALTIDHIIPLSMGGDHRRENLRPAHALCNSRRGNRIDEPVQLALPVR